MGARTRIDWRKCANRLAELLPRERLHPAVLRWTRDENASAGPWAVAFSGGADSLAVLLLVWSLWPERRAKLRALHFNHRLRGAAADRDESFCRDVCSALGVGYASAEWKRPPHPVSEAAARGARHEFFSTQLRRWRAHALWLGHQQDDVAETILMRLARGSGLGGLAAPRPVQSFGTDRVHLRPLLSLQKAEILDSLRECGAHWREDASNRGKAFLRNRIRHDILPAWRAASGARDALRGIALSRELMEEDDSALDQWVAELAPIAASGALNVARLAGKPRGVVRRALHLWLLKQGKGENLSRQAFDAVLQDLVRHRRTRHSLNDLHLIEIGRRYAKVVDAPRKFSK